MSANALIKNGELFPVLFDDFFRSRNGWFDNDAFNGQRLHLPAVNIIESKNDYAVSLAVPGMKKDDFNIGVNGSLLTISCNKEEKKEEKEAKFTRKEYNYTSFSRSFTLPDEVNKEKIDAHYENGILKLSLPKKEEAGKLAAKKQIAVK